MKIYLTLLVFCTSLTCVTSAEEKTLSFAAFQNEALQKSPFVKEIEFEAVSMQAKGVELSTIKNPELSAEIRPFVAGEDDKDQEYEIALSLPLRLTNFGTRRTVADLMEKLSSEERKLALLQFSQELRLLYGKVWAYQLADQNISSSLKLVESFASTIKVSNQKGLLPMSTVKLLDAQVAKLKVDKIGLIGDRVRSQGELSQRSGVIVTGDKLQAIHLTEITIIDPSSGFSMINRLKLRNELAASQRTLAKLDSFPEFAPRIAFEHTDDGAERVIAGITMPLPIFDRNRAERIQTAAAKDHTQAQVDFLEHGGFQSVVESLRVSANSALQQSNLYRDQIIPALKSALTETRREFENGKGEPSLLIQALSELIASQERYIELYAKALSARIELSIFLGEEV